MTATVRLIDGTSIAFDSVAGRPESNLTRGMLITLEGKRQGDLVTCVLVPVAQIGAVIESMRLVQSQLLP